MECGGFMLIPWECHCPSSKLVVPWAAALLVVADGSIGRPESTGAEALGLGLAPRTESEAETGRTAPTDAEADALPPTMASEDEGMAIAPAFRATAARTIAEDV